ncbi:hypothetical protein QZH41_016948 [Actinostola sp. cb2023]|nr:hypothetical protein QZH41_016948 [Actinostola sp. cb2023]
MPPISTWGKAFLIKSTAYRKVGDIFHILASQDQTAVRIQLSSGPLVVTINAGEFYEFDAPQGTSHVILTSNPCLVVQYGKSRSVDNSNFGPFMSIVPATDQWSNDYTLVVPSALSSYIECYADVFVRDRDAKSIVAKSISPVHAMTWTRVPFTVYWTATVKLTSGQYRFYHTSPLKFFSVMFLCNADYEAFGFPAGLRIFRRSPTCRTNPPMVPGDRRDSDCDGRADEELLNGIDDDGDGKIDEDLATPIPVIQAPASVNESECYIPHISEVSTPKHQAFGMCNVRGNLTIFYNDVSLPSKGCWKYTNRTWTLTDGCLNTITQTQIVNIYVQQPLVVDFPSSFEVPIDCDKLASGQYDSGKPTVASNCTGKVSVSYKDHDWSKVRDCGYTKTVVVKRTWVVSTSCNNKTHIQYLRFQKEGWYPHVTMRPWSLLSAAEENVTLRCYVLGNPEPKVKWILPNGQYVDKSYSIHDIEVLDDLSQRTRVKTMQKDNSLLISETRVRDSGIYQCVATNALGNDTGTVNLTIHDDIVDVDASVTLKDQVYSESLEGQQSQDFATLAKIMKRELTKVFKNITGFQGINILGFRNGSVKVIFRVEIKKQNKDENPQVIVNKVGQHLAVSVKGGKLGDYNVVPTVELREKPPQPNKPQASEIQESTVHIQWDPPDLSALFAISGYLLQYKRFGHVTWMTYDIVKGDNHRIDGLDAGTGYLIRTKAQNQYGHSKPSGSLEITTLDTSLSGAEMALIIIIPIIVIITCVALAWFFYKRRVKISGFQRSSSDRLLDNGVVRYFRPAQAIDENHKWKDISRDCLELGRVLGEGEFGMVIEGKLTQEDGSVIRCAVKKLKRTANVSDMKDLLNELDIMVQVGSHPNIVNLIGACVFEGSVMVVLEFAANGNLLRHLQKQRSKSYDDMTDYQIHIAPKQRLQIASDVANGMAHLARRKCVHRDLAARNVLLDESWTAKVSDFGLSRDVYANSVYEKTTGGKLPAKWMAIEALEAGLNTSQSDV